MRTSARHCGSSDSILLKTNSRKVLPRISNESIRRSMVVCPFPLRTTGLTRRLVMGGQHSIRQVPFAILSRYGITLVILTTEMTHTAANQALAFLGDG